MQRTRAAWVLKCLLAAYPIPTIDEAPLTDHCSYKLNTNEPWIAGYDAGTENPVNMKIGMGPSHWRGHTVKLARLVFNCLTSNYMRPADLIE